MNSSERVSIFPWPFFTELHHWRDVGKRKRGLLMSPCYIRSKSGCEDGGECRKLERFGKGDDFSLRLRNVRSYNKFTATFLSAINFDLPFCPFLILRWNRELPSV